MALRTYRAPWKGEALFVCRKCQRKMKRGGTAALAKVKKWFKKRAKKGNDACRCMSSRSHAIGLCPKGGVTVFSRAGSLQVTPPRVCIARSKADLRKALLRTYRHVQPYPRRNVTLEMTRLSLVGRNILDRAVAEVL